MDLELKEYIRSTATNARLLVLTHFPYRVVNIYSDGQYVDLESCLLEYQYDKTSSLKLVNSFGNVIPVHTTQKSIIRKVPVKQFKFGHFSIQARPVIGDEGYIEVFYDDTSRWQQQGGTVAPGAFNVTDINNCVFVPSLINQKTKDVNYAPEGEFVIKSTNTSIILKDAQDGSGTPSIEINSSGNVNVNSQQTTITGDAKIEGNLEVIGNITGATIKETTTNVNLGTHIHDATMPGAPGQTSGTPQPGS